MTPTERTRGTRVELFGRETLPEPAAGRFDRVESRLGDLAAADAVAAFGVQRWPKRVPRDGSADPAVRDAYLAFTEWAEESGVELAPFFGTRECYSMETGERGEWLVLPALCLAVYEDGQLQAVYPHADGDTYRSVGAGLRSLEREASDRQVGPSTATVAD